MGDSEDEYDRKRRDKFRGERTESYRSGEGRRDDRRREDWIERDTWGAGRPRARGDYRGGVRDRYSPARQHELSPPIKRIRTDWGEERRMGYGDHGGYNYGPWGPEPRGDPYPNRGGGGGMGGPDQLETQPPILSFKAFLQTQDDNITDEEAIRKYNEYKLEFRRQQLNEFFVAHKEEEWFKLKYHPEDSVKRKEEQMAGLRKRVSVFMEMLEGGKLDSVSVDCDQSDQLVKLLDAVVIRLEGGTDLDLTILDEPPPSAEAEQPAEAAVPTIKAEADLGNVKEEKDNGDVELVISETGEEEKGEEEEGKEKEGEKVDDGMGGLAEKSEEDLEEALVSSPVVGSKKGDEEEEADTEMEVEEPKLIVGNGIEKERTEEEKSEDLSLLEQNENSAGGEPAKADMEVDEAGDAVSAEDAEKKAVENEKGEEGEQRDEGDSESKPQQDDVPKPRALHRTASIFLRNLAPTITKAEVETMCKRYPGFLRVAIADPQPDRRWFRRGWVTFQRDVIIKEICWNLNNIRLRDCELGAIVNRDLSRRIRTVSGLTGHKQVILHDMKLSAKLIHNLDARHGFWQEGKPQEESFGLISLNPVLRNITDYLIEEASAEEEELLGQTAETDDSEEKDQALLKVLDRLLFYLRIIHSVDYYNHCEYPNEDEMPNRCGIMHARGSAPTSKVTGSEIADYCRGFQQKMACLMTSSGVVEGAELVALGAKQPDGEVEKFVLANTQELAKDKWLCPLSGKKFKGPEFVRKHIFNKHAEKVEEVKKEVEYFNNYLRDPKRPQLAEHPGNRPTKKEPSNEPPPASFAPPFQYGGFAGGRGFQHYGGFGSYGSGYNRGGYNRGGFNRSARGGGDYRPMINYRDLDAPREPEEFI